MTEFLMCVTLIGWPVLMMRAGEALSRYLRDREIDRELAEGGW